MIKTIVLTLSLIFISSMVSAKDYKSNLRSGNFRLQSRSQLFDNGQRLVLQQKFLENNLDLFRLYKYPIPKGLFLREAGFYGRKY